MFSIPPPCSCSLPMSIHIFMYVPYAHYFFRIPSYAEGSPFNYALVMNDIVKAVEQQYPDIMGTVYSLLDPEEMKIMKKQAQDIKSKQGH